MSKSLYEDVCVRISWMRLAKAVEQSDREVARYKKTVMTVFDRHLLLEGKVECADYDRAKTFSGSVMTVESIDQLAAVLTELQGSTRRAHVRAALLPGVDLTHFERLVNRQKDGREPTMIEVPRRYVLFDVDDVPAAEGWHHDLEATALDLVENWFPLEFSGCSFVATATGSAGMKPGIRMRVGWLLVEPLCGRDIAPLMDLAPVDVCTLHPAQLVYTAAPSFDGLPDPVRQRVVVHHCTRDRVPLIPLPQGQAAERPVVGQVGARAAGPRAHQTAYDPEHFDRYLRVFDELSADAKNYLLREALACVDASSVGEGCRPVRVRVIGLALSTCAPNAREIIHAQNLAWYGHDDPVKQAQARQEADKVMDYFEARP